MCGRFTYRYTWSEIHALYRLTTPPSNLQPRYNVCPTTTINTVIARDGQNVFINGQCNGNVTSGSPAPFLKKNIGMAYVPIEFASVGQRIEIDVRGKLAGAEIVPLPFYKRAK